MPASKLLINEHPLQVLPSLACALGLNEAMLLQQVHYWISRPDAKERDGRRWLYNSYAEWQQQFPFWSISTIRRTIDNLEQRGVLLSGNYNAAAMDRTKWYTIDYAALDALAVGDPARSPLPFIGNHKPSAESRRPSAQNEHITGSPRTGQVLTLSKPIPETTVTETTPRERETAPSPSFEQFEPSAADRDWLVAECASATLPRRAVDPRRETAAWRDAIRAGHRPVPADPAADWRIWLRRAVTYATTHPTEGGSAHGTLEHRARRTTADDEAADAAAQQLVADLAALSRPGRDPG
jgi:hypothetical protein